jgi:cytochrome C oxidase polypeptide Vb (fragment)
MVRHESSKEKPNIVLTFEPKRLIGCICEEDATSIKYMWVHIGEPKRCSCGYWFKAIQAPDPFEPLKGQEVY